jgi:F420-dependent methylenetetrahydromethanopterin dehydrogenase
LKDENKVSRFLWQPIRFQCRVGVFRWVEESVRKIVEEIDQTKRSELIKLMYV